MEGDVLLSAATMVAALARIEQGQKQLGLVNHGYGVRLSIVEVQRLAREQREAAQASASPRADPA